MMRLNKQKTYWGAPLGTRRRCDVESCNVSTTSCAQWDTCKTFNILNTQHALYHTDHNVPDTPYKASQYNEVYGDGVIYNIFSPSCHSKGISGDVNEFHRVGIPIKYETLTQCRVNWVNVSYVLGIRLYLNCSKLQLHA